ncbi:MAG: transposase, partial [Solobacterium sp.]|nr:transposase [Solobacterium sp.]
VKSHDYLFAEDLKVRNLKKNHKLAKAISDSGWRTFLTELQNTASKRGKTCLLVNPRNTTQTCSSCGCVMSDDNRIVLGQEEWVCPVCGTHHVRDHNAAINIKNAGLALLQESGIAIDNC